MRDGLSCGRTSSPHAPGVPVARSDPAAMVASTNQLLIERLQNHGDPLPAADAQGGQAVAALATL